MDDAKIYFLFICRIQTIKSIARKFAVNQFSKNNKIMHID